MATPLRAFDGLETPCHAGRLVRCPQEANPSRKSWEAQFLAIVEAARSDIGECEAHDLRAMMDDGEPLVVIDVRERHEFEAGHLEGAVHIGKGVLERDIEKQELADDVRIVLYCGGGFRRPSLPNPCRTWAGPTSLVDGAAFSRRPTLRVLKATGS